MEFYYLCKAQDEEVQEATIVINRQLPIVDQTNLTEIKAIWQTEGLVLANALWNTLPGGTIDQLIASLLERRASLFKVRF